MLGTMANSAFFRWASEVLAPLDGADRIIMTLAGTLVHGGIVVGIFLLLLPQSKVVLRRLLQRK
jgi:hypothetical protein